MSMHLAPAFVSTTRYSSKGKKLASSNALRTAKEQHEKWLRDRGLAPEQLAKTPKSVGELPNLKIKENAKLSNNLAVRGGFRNGVLDNLHKESPEVQKAILDKAKRTAPAYSKGAYQYITDGANLTDIGKKK